MVDKQRKSEHKKVIQYMRRMNKQIAEDEYLGLNRFRIDEYAENWTKFDDGSGGILTIFFKMTDKATGNTAYFIADNYDYTRKIIEHTNDFLIRCSSGREGHYPPLHYVAYDVHEIIPYAGNKRELSEPKESVIDTYSWVGSIKFDDEKE